MGKKIKSGMYGEMPTIKIGKYTIAMMTDKKDEKRIWIREGEEEAGEFDGLLLEPYIKEFFNKNF